MGSWGKPGEGSPHAGAPWRYEGKGPQIGGGSWYSAGVEKYFEEVTEALYDGN